MQETYPPRALSRKSNPGCQRNLWSDPNGANLSGFWGFL